jgi:hypothetical protein
LSRRQKQQSPPGGTSAVAWIALVIAVIALGVSLLDRPWLGRVKENWPLVQEEFDRLRERRAEEAQQGQVAEGQEAPEHLREARRAAILGDEESLKTHLLAARDGLLVHAESLRASAARQCRNLAEEIGDLTENLEAGLRNSRMISDLAERAESLLGGGESDDSTEPDSVDDEPSDAGSTT